MSKEETKVNPAAKAPEKPAVEKASTTEAAVKKPAAPAAPETAPVKKEADSKPVNPQFSKLIAEIEKMSIKELNDFVQTVQSHFNIVPLSVSTGGEQSKSKTPENVNIVLTEVGQSKIAVIKALGTITGKGLMEAKKMTETLPSTILENKPTADAETIKEQLEAAGASVELK